MKSLFLLFGFFVFALTLQAQPLRELARPHDLLIGTCVGGSRIERDDQYTEVLAREFNIVVAENDMKFHKTHPAPDQYTFDAADTIVDFAVSHNMKVRGHTLVWHRSVPDWLKDREWTKRELMDVLRDHIQTVAGRYQGKILAWDVVNEAVVKNGDWREDSFWYKQLGKEYLYQAFRWAKEAAPDALLFYNDYAAETMNKKSDAVYNLVKQMQADGVPIDGVGFQLHVKAKGYPSISSIRKNIRRLAGLGLQVHFTEIDARIKLPASEDDLQQQAQCYRELLQLCLEEPNCTAFLTWGFTDKYSWVYNHFDGWGDALPFDKNFQPKPAYYAMQTVLKETQPSSVQESR